LADSKVRVLNVVVSGSLGRKVDLWAVASAFPSVEYRPEMFPGVVFRLENPKATVLLFENGKFVCSGAKSEREAEEAVLRLAELLRASGIEVEKPRIKVTNIVATGDLEGHIDLYGLCDRAGATASTLLYEPEQFPAAVYRMENPRVAFLLFSTGKIICAGAKRTEEIHEAFKKLKQWLNDMEAIYTYT